MALRTPLYDRHVAAHARMIEFAGWDMPLQYSGIVEEHLTVRKAVGLFDVSHMGKLLIEGPAAHAFLDGLSANDVPTRPGRARYTHLLREDGTTIDDVIVSVLAPDRFFLVCNAGPRATVVAWLESHRPDTVRISDRTSAYLCLALQGPRAPELLQRFTSTDLAAIKPFWATDIAWRAPSETKGWGSNASDLRMGPSSGVAPTDVSGAPPFFTSRTGYTGEAGFELFPPATMGARVWEALLVGGADLGIKPIGLGARDTLRLEKGYLLSGQDFDGRQTPLELACDWVVKWDRPFVGRDALVAQRAHGNFRRLAGLRMSDRAIPRHGFEVLASGRNVGIVTSGTLSPSLRIGIALASVQPTHSAESSVLDVDVRGTPHPATVVRPPFV
jgi:glycine cleavage system T protein (aminomethyltransferase)